MTYERKSKARVERIGEGVWNFYEEAGKRIATHDTKIEGSLRKSSLALEEAYEAGRLTPSKYQQFSEMLYNQEVQAKPVRNTSELMEDFILRACDETLKRQMKEYRRVA